MQYRKEIDGLRALAIVPVIFFHADFTLFTGGFVGVDVFFVISGFLITSLLLEEYRDKHFSFLNFYERRARRILPALFLMLLVSAACAYRILSPWDLSDFAKSLLGANLFVANIAAYQQSGYFDASSAIKPLLHIWSLSIEEQYYFVLPILLVVLLRWGARALTLGLGILLAASLFASERKLSQDNSAAFYFIYSRAWELLLGSACALVSLKQLQKVSGWLQQTTAFAGIAMIVFAILTFTQDTPFPGLFALIPTVGTALVLLFAQRTTLVGKWLANPLFVGIGLISYSAYLWHQPVFAFYRYQSLNHPTQTAMLVCIALSFLLAYLSWAFVEKPFRDKNRFTKKQIFMSALVGIFAFCSIAIITHKTKGFPNRFPAEYANAFDPPKVKEGKFCHFTPLNLQASMTGCEFGDVASTWVVFLIGDSHASSLIGALDEEFQRLHIKGVRVRLRDCPHNIPGMASGQISQKNQQQIDACLENFDAFLKLTKSTANAVVVSIRWTPKLYPIPQIIDTFAYDNGEGGVEYKDPASNYARSNSGELTIDGDAKRQTIIRFTQSLANTNKQIFLVHAIPEVGWDVPRFNFTNYMHSGKVNPNISTSHERFVQRNAFISEALQATPASNVVHIKPEQFFCSTIEKGRCMAQTNHQPLYYDSNHLATEGARPLAHAIGAHLRPSSALNADAPKLHAP